MRTVLALLAAAAMVAAAFAVRARLDTGEATTGRTGRPADEGPLALTCVPELESACRALAAAADVVATVETAGATGDRLAASTTGEAPDAWLTLAPWPGIVADERERAGLQPVLADAGAPLARSPLVIVAVAERAAVLAPHCAEQTVGWECIGEAAPATWSALGGEAAWGPVKPGHRPADTSASGLLVFAQATADYFGRADLSAADLADPAYRQWVTGLERSIPGFGTATTTPLDQLLLQGPAAYDFVGTTEAEAGAAVDGPRGEGLEVVRPRPVRTADVVLAVPPGERGARASVTLGALAADALTTTGWRSADDAGLPAEDGLPPAGLLQALRTLWREVT